MTLSQVAILSDVSLDAELISEVFNQCLGDGRRNLVGKCVYAWLVLPRNMYRRNNYVSNDDDFYLAASQDLLKCFTFKTSREIRTKHFLTIQAPNVIQEYETEISPPQNHPSSPPHLTSPKPPTHSKPISSIGNAMTVVETWSLSFTNSIQNIFLPILICRKAWACPSRLKRDAQRQESRAQIRARLSPGGRL